MSRDIFQVISERHSCRRYRKEPLKPEDRLALEKFLASQTQGPFGSSLRLVLLAATEQDQGSLKGLGTYGFIKNPAAFIAGAVTGSPKDMEDYGYVVERAVLFATELGLGSCWLGGTFTKSSFAKRVGLGPQESMPAVVALGYEQQEDPIRSRLRTRVGATERLPAERLFFEAVFDQPIKLVPEEPLARILEAVRWAPSASNKQPWRIVRIEGSFHFYLERSKGYGKGSLLFRVLGLADLQRVDMGIAMCHFELAAREVGLRGNWGTAKPALLQSRGNREYIGTWEPEIPAITAGLRPATPRAAQP